MFTFKFEGLERPDAQTPYYYGSLPAKPKIGQRLFYEDTGNYYLIIGIEGEGLTGDSDTEDQKALAWAEIARREKVPTLFLRKISGAPPTPRPIKPTGRSFDPEEVKRFSQYNRQVRLKRKPRR